MSLFIKSLTKSIIEYMHYKDEELISLSKELLNLKEKMNKGVIVCKHILEDTEYMGDRYACEECSIHVCETCLDESWIFMTYMGDCHLPDKVNNSKYVLTCLHQDQDISTFYEMTEYIMHCSEHCFREYYGASPVVGKCYRKQLS